MWRACADGREVQILPGDFVTVRLPVVGTSDEEGLVRVAGRHGKTITVCSDDVIAYEPATDQGRLNRWFSLNGKSDLDSGSFVS